MQNCRCLGRERCCWSQSGPGRSQKEVGPGWFLQKQGPSSFCPDWCVGGKETGCICICVFVFVYLYLCISGLVSVCVCKLSMLARSAAVRFSKKIAMRAIGPMSRLAKTLLS